MPVGFEGAGLSKNTGSRGPLWFLIRAFFHHGCGCLRRVRGGRGSKPRSPARVKKKYDHLRRNILLTTLDEFLHYPNPQAAVLVEDRIRFLPISHATHFEEFLDLINRHWSGGAIIEVGSGAGRNLLFLRKHFPNVRLYGLELSPESVDLARRASLEFSLPVEFQCCDVTQDIPELSDVDVVFTFHAFEKMPRLIEKVSDNIRRLDPKTVVLLEPITEMWPWSFREIVSRLRVYHMDRVRGIMKKLNMLGRVFEARRLEYSTNALNETVLVIIKMNKGASRKSLNMSIERS